MKTLVAVLMCLQTLHLCLTHGLLHSGSSPVIVILIKLDKGWEVVWKRILKVEQRYLQSFHHHSECGN